MTRLLPCLAAGALAAALVLLAPAAPARAQERYMVIAGGSTGGLFFIVAAGMGRVIERHVPNTRVTAQVTSGSVENVRLMGQRRVDCGLTSADAVFYGARGEGPFQNERYTNIRYVSRGYTSVLQSIVLANSPIQGLADLRGRRVGILIGITAQYWFPAIAATHGLRQGQDFRISVLRATELVNALRDGNADIAIYWGGAPTATISDIATSRSVRFLPLGEAEAATVMRDHPYFARAPLPGGTYPGQAQDVPSLVVPILLTCREDVPEEMMYALTRALMEGSEELRQIHPEAASFNLQNAGQSMVVPIHPGAARYYRERGVRLGS